jgi:hypothetical protein
LAIAGFSLLCHAISTGRTTTGVAITTKATIGEYAQAVSTACEDTPVVPQAFTALALQVHTVADFTLLGGAISAGAAHTIARVKPVTGSVAEKLASRKVKRFTRFIIEPEVAAVADLS